MTARSQIIALSTGDRRDNAAVISSESVKGTAGARVDVALKYLSDHIETVRYGGSKSDWQSFCDSITTYYNTNLTNVKNVVFGK